MARCCGQSTTVPPTHPHSRHATHSTTPFLRHAIHQDVPISVDDVQQVAASRYAETHCVLRPYALMRVCLHRGLDLSVKELGPLYRVVCRDGAQPKLGLPIINTHTPKTHPPDSVKRPSGHSSSDFWLYGAATGPHPLRCHAGLHQAVRPVFRDSHSGFFTYAQPAMFNHEASSPMSSSPNDVRPTAWGGKRAIVCVGVPWAWACW